VGSRVFDAVKPVRSLCVRAWKTAEERHCSRLGRLPGCEGRPRWFERRIELQYLVEVSDGTNIVALVVVGDAAAVIGERILRIEPDRL
jgi:hypothetical protein